MVCVNQYEAGLARRWLRVRRERLEVIPTTVRDCPRRVAPEQDRVTLAMIARLAPPKRVDLLIEALGEFSAPTVDVWIVGDGPQRDALEALAAGVVGHRIRFLGDRADVDELLGAAQLFVLLSDHEGAPLTVLEAQRAGLPLIVSDLPGIRVQAPQGAMFVRNEVASVASAVRTLAMDCSLVAALGRASRLQFEAAANPRQVAGAIERAYLRSITLSRRQRWRRTASRNHQPG
jgi:glycosyltransferase involved in cell wall biosynthesis